MNRPDPRPHRLLHLTLCALTSLVIAQDARAQSLIRKHTFTKLDGKVFQIFDVVNDALQDF